MNVVSKMLSRFKTRKEQKAIVEDLASGKVDIIIGTHRLLSKDVHFADLGLLVVDEEQRFGVKHKEKLIYGLQFHPEVNHTPEGEVILRNFLRVCEK